MSTDAKSFLYIYNEKEDKREGGHLPFVFFLIMSFCVLFSSHVLLLHM